MTGEETPYDDEDEGEGEPQCPFCDNTDVSCAHVALLFEHGERISGGAAYAKANAFMVALDKALVGSAYVGADLVHGECRDLCEKAMQMARRKRSPINPDNAAAELYLARFWLLESILESIPGVEVGERPVGYGGFCAEGSGKVVWERSAGTVESTLKREILALDVDWEGLRGSSPGA